MYFNFSQIQDMLSILRSHELVFVATQVGPSYLTAADKAILLASGIDLNKQKTAFLFGILASAIGDKRAKKMSYQQFQKFLASGGYVPITEQQRYALAQMKTRAYNDITNLGNRMRNAVSNTVVNNNRKRAAMVKKMIRSKTLKAIELRQSARQLAAELAEASQDWEVDWQRIASYLMHEAYNTGRAAAIEEEAGPNAEVYFDVYPGACKRCRELYLTDPDDPNSEPKIFNLAALRANGSNIGRKVAQWLPSIEPTHPYCRCTLEWKRPDRAWDSNVRAFTKVIKKVSKNPKLQGVKLNIKVTKG
ncbi:MAG: hypothetical protein IJ882_03045 [Paludibacteraceae bacterium]|nr:hypothetical protein [Paludibacteraceae bacterium]